MNPFRQKSWIYLFLCTIYLAAGCAGPGTRSEWPEMHGRVLDADTKQPVAGTIIVAFWEGYGGHAEICFHSETVITDKNGEYLIPAWENIESTKNLTYQTVDVGVVHKDGYRITEPVDEQPSNSRTQHYLIRDNSTYSSRLIYLANIPALCNPDIDTNSQQAWPLIEMTYREAVNLPVTDDDKYMVRVIIRPMVSLSNEDPINWYTWSYQESLDFAENQLEIRKHGQ